MLLELEAFAVSLLAALLLLSALALGVLARSGSTRTKDKITAGDDGPRKEYPPVVRLSYIQSALRLFPFICNPRIPTYETLAKIHKDCGDLLIIPYPFKRQVALNVADISTAKSIMASSAWANRLPEDHYFYALLDRQPVGLIFGNGGYLKDGRKLVLRLLQQFGFFRQGTIEAIVHLEARELLEKEFFGKIRTSQKKTVAVVSMHHIFQIYTLNVICRVPLGRRFTSEDPTVQTFMSILNNFNQSFDLGRGALDFFPWLRHLPFIRFQTEWVEFNRFFKEYFQKEFIGPRRRSGSYRTSPLDFVDYFLLEVDKRAGEDPCYLNDVHLAACMRDIFLAAMDTTNAALECGILHVCLQPEIQRKVQEEIDTVIEATREPCYDDRKGMPYTQAVLLEILRYSTPVPIVPRCPLRDEMIHGQHEIPKDSICGINLYAIHRDPQVWTDPEDFHPERFLNEQQSELINLDKILPFGYGTRACFGKTVAEINLFIFFVSLLQKFTFELSEEHGPPCMKNTTGLSHGPPPYYVQVSVREREAKLSTKLDD